jgi:hypothetical protein
MGFRSALPQSFNPKAALGGHDLPPPDLSTFAIFVMFATYVNIEIYVRW